MKQSSTLVSGLSLAACLYYQNKFCTTLFIGALFNALVGKILKLIINEKRPKDSTRDHNTHGMPSSHAGSLSFFVIFLSLEASVISFSYGAVTYALTMIYACCVCWCRVYRSRDHTVPQILVGLLVGHIMGFMTFLFYTYYLL
jgi:acid phosphatase family membrane protein YuiD